MLRCITEEFAKLLEHDAEYMGKAYGCHQKDETVCRGFVMDQRERDVPSICLHLSMNINQVPYRHIETYWSPVHLYPSVQAMAHANYPDQFPPTAPLTPVRYPSDE